MGEIRGTLQMLHILLLLNILSLPIMRTSGILLGLFYAPVLSLFWLTKHAVEAVKLSAPAVVTGAYGGSVTVPCQYDPQFRDYTKYWCRGLVYELCAIVVKTPKNRPNERSSIADDKMAGIFTVTMTSLSSSDDDMYWCVIARRGKNLHTGVRLRVSQTAITTTSATTNTQTSLSPVTQDEICWWAILRWILFILMLCCLVSTHIIAWRIKTAIKCGRTNSFNNKPETLMTKFGKTIIMNNG